MAELGTGHQIQLQSLFLKSVRSLEPLLDKEAGTFVCAEAVSVRALLSCHLDVCEDESLTVKGSLRIGGCGTIEQQISELSIPYEQELSGIDSVSSASQPLCKG